MRCHICNARLTRVEIQRDKRERGGYKPCRNCIGISKEVYTIDEIFKNILGDDLLDYPDVEQEQVLV